jgi:chemotaxis protein MotA
MRKRDLLTPIGITVGFIMIALAIISSGGTEGFVSFVDIASFFIVIGGLIASMLVTFKKEQIKLAGKVIKESMYKNDLKVSELIGLFIRLAERARREGLLALENELEKVDDPFIRKGVMLAIDGVEPEVVTDILNAEITAMEERHYKGRSLIEKAAEYAPSWGMIGTLIGLILMLNRLEDPATLGPSMAVALLTTLYGTVLANLCFSPLANKLLAKTEEEVFMKQIVIEGIIGIQSGQNPRILEEKLAAFMSSEDEIKKPDEEIEASPAYTEENIS